MPILGIIGAGHIGSNVARAAIAAGYDVVISNSRGPESLTDLVAELGSRATAGTTTEAAAASELVLVAVPLGKIASVPAEALAGKVVLDANNYYPGRDGRIGVLDRNESTTSEFVAQHLPGARVVKAFNHIPALDIPKDGLPAGDPKRRALVIAGDDAAAKVFASAFLDDIGFDTYDLGPLSESWRIERDTPDYVRYRTRAELAESLPHVERIQQI